MVSENENQDKVTNPFTHETSGFLRGDHDGGYGGFTLHLTERDANFRSRLYYLNDIHVEVRSKGVTLDMFLSYSQAAILRNVLDATLNHRDMLDMANRADQDDTVDLDEEQRIANQS